MDLNSAKYNSKVGFEFEFFSDLPEFKLKTSLKNTLRKNIVIVNPEINDITPTNDLFILTRDLSGGQDMWELITGPLMYTEARLILIHTLKWIQSNGYTTNKTSIHLNISFDNKKDPSANILNLNILKFILEFNEDRVYELFPNRKKSIYARSIKQIYPISKFKVPVLEDKTLFTQGYKFPDNKYYGVNFTKRLKNYLEFRYIGGEEYEYKIQDISELLDLFIETTHKSLSEKYYTEENFNTLVTLLNKHKRAINAYQSLNAFKKSFSQIELTVDLNRNERYVNAYFERFRDLLFDIINDGMLRKGYVNFDSDSSTLQIKDATINNPYELRHLELVNCTINNGNLISCKLYESTVNDSKLYNTKLYYNTLVRDSMLKGCYIDGTSVVNTSYIFGDNSIINGIVVGGIFREGNITKRAQISRDVEVITYKKID